MPPKGALNMAAGKGKGTKLTKAVAKEKKGAVRAERERKKWGKTSHQRIRWMNWKRKYRKRKKMRERTNLNDELNRIRLIEFNSIGFDLISLNRICLSTGPAGTSAAPITDAKGPDMHRPVAAVKVRGQLQEGWWPCSSDGDDHCPGQARQLGATCSRDRRRCESGG